jgi:non-homologous end joining protein Ku
LVPATLDANALGNRAIALQASNQHREGLLATLLEQNMGAFVPAEEDSFLANTRRMLEAKSAGLEVSVPTVAAVPSSDEDLMAQLQKSLAMAAGK